MRKYFAEKKKTEKKYTKGMILLTVEGEAL